MTNTSINSCKNVRKQSVSTVTRIENHIRSFGSTQVGTAIQYTRAFCSHKLKNLIFQLPCDSHHMEGRSEGHTHSSHSTPSLTDLAIGHLAFFWEGTARDRPGN